MPRIDVRFYCDADGDAPVLRWFEDLARRDRRAYLKCRELVDRLAEFGHELRRPAADHLQDGVYELRARVGRVNCRILYFFHGREAAILSHGLMKEREIPRMELKRALARMQLYLSDPARHTYREEL